MANHVIPFSNSEIDEAIQRAINAIIMSQIKNTLTETETGNVLDATKAKALKDLIDAITTNLNGNITDSNIGNRTITDSTQPSADAAAITTLLSNIGYMLKAITGKANWRTNPAKSLEDFNNHLLDFVRNNNYAVDSGTANALDVTLNPAAAAYSDGMIINIRKGSSNNSSSSVTINANSLGAKNILDTAGNAIKPNALIANKSYTLMYNSQADAFILLAGARSVTFTATITATWTGSSAPYTQTVAVTGLASTDIIMVSPVYDANNTTAIAQKEAWNFISKIVPGTNSIDITCFEDKPVTAIPIQIRVVI